MQPAFAALCIVVAASDTPASPPSKVSGDADALVRRMSDYLASLERFSFSATSTTEVVANDRERLQFPVQSQVTLERPNHLRSERKRSDRDTTFYYDGTDMTIYTTKANAFASIPAPPTLAGAIDFARDRLGIEAPAADLLTNNAYQSLMEDVTEGRDLGVEEIDGVSCHHLAFRNPRTDWQIWIADGYQPLPYRFTIVSKDVAGAPEFNVVLSHWQIEPVLGAAFFKFTPPAGATKVDFYVEAQRAKQPQRAHK